MQKEQADDVPPVCAEQKGKQDSASQALASCQRAAVAFMIRSEKRKDIITYYFMYFNQNIKKAGFLRIQATWNSK